MLLSGECKSLSDNSTLLWGQERDKFQISVFFYAFPGMKHALDSFLSYFVQDCGLNSLVGLAFEVNGNSHHLSVSNVGFQLMTTLLLSDSPNNTPWLNFPVVAHKNLKLVEHCNVLKYY